jgi:uncharacterized protein
VEDPRPFAVERPRRPVPADLANFIKSDVFPCVGAKSALALGQLHVFEAGAIGEPLHDADLRHALYEFSRHGLAGSSAVASFACLFRPGHPPLSEVQFERALWARLQGLHDLDAAAGVDWAHDVSGDPASVHFSMSVAGTAFFVIGLHPRASRAARRFHRPAMIFNPHDQFTRLRADGRYDAIRQIVRAKELRMHGDINPMLGDFGEASEARQYSGRVAEAGWQCPLKRRT